MEAILQENRELGWKEVPASCPPAFRARIAAKRKAILARSSTPAAPAVAPQRVSDADRTVLAARLSNAIKLF